MLTLAKLPPNKLPPAGLPSEELPTGIMEDYLPENYLVRSTLVLGNCTHKSSVYNSLEINGAVNINLFNFPLFRDSDLTPFL